MAVQRVARPRRNQREASCVCRSRITWTAARGWLHVDTGAPGCDGGRPTRRRREREAPDLGAFIARMLRALVARAEAGDLDVLAVLAAAADQLDTAVNDSARALRDRHDYSCAAIGAELGMSRQAVLKRLGSAHEVVT